MTLPDPDHDVLCERVLCEEHSDRATGRWIRGLPVEGGVRAGAWEEAPVEGLLREGVVGGVCGPRHHINVHRARKLSQAHVCLPAPHSPTLRFCST